MTLQIVYAVIGGMGFAVFSYALLDRSTDQLGVGQRPVPKPSESPAGRAVDEAF